MLPTSYRGNATIDGEVIDAVLRLDDGHLRLTTRADAQILRWPLGSLAVESTGEGEYRLEAGNEHFAFAPLYDDGLGVEIALRRKFIPDEGGTVMTAPRVDAQPGGVPAKTPKKSTVRNQPKDPRNRRSAHLGGEGATTPSPGRIGRKTRQRKAKKRTANPSALLTVAEQAVGRASSGRRRRGVLDGGDLGLGTAIIVLGLLAGVIGAVAWLSDDSVPAPAVTLEAPVESSPSTLPFTEPDTPVPTAAPPPVSPTSVPAPPTTAPATTVPPTTATTTNSTTVSSVVPIGETALNLTPPDLIARWDAQAAALEPGLTASELTTDGAAFSFEVGDHVVVEGNTDADNTIANLDFVGDPSGDVDADRRVLAALGLTVAMLEPDLPPLGRRQFLAALGLDIEQPDLEGLDRSMEYNDRSYRLRWDADRVRLVLSGSEAVLETADAP